MQPKETPEMTQKPKTGISSEIMVLRQMCGDLINAFDHIHSGCASYHEYDRQAITVVELIRLQLSNMENTSC